MWDKVCIFHKIIVGWDFRLSINEHFLCHCVCNAQPCSEGKKCFILSDSAENIGTFNVGG